MERVEREKSKFDTKTLSNPYAKFCSSEIELVTVIFFV